MKLILTDKSELFIIGYKDQFLIMYYCRFAFEFENKEKRRKQNEEERDFVTPQIGRNNF